MIDLMDLMERLLKDEDVVTTDAASVPLGLDQLLALVVEAVVVDADEGSNGKGPAISKAVSGASSGSDPLRRVISSRSWTFIVRLSSNICSTRSRNSAIFALASDTE
jgi:hypothetical protein